MADKGRADSGGSASRLAVLGAGQLGEILIRGWIEAGLTEPAAVTVTTLHGVRSRSLADKLGVGAAASNRDAVRGRRRRPPHRQAAAGRAGAAGDRAAAHDLAAPHLGGGIRVDRHARAASATSRARRARDAEHSGARAAGHDRALPGTSAGPEHVAHAERLFGAVGQTIVLDERHMDAVTGLSASGPAFLYIVIESLADGGVKVGLPRDVALRLAAQTVLGSGAMVRETGQHPALLKDAVTTPSGTTIDGILELEDGGVRVAMLKAVVRATRRATERAHELFGDAGRK